MRDARRQEFRAGRVRCTDEELDVIERHARLVCDRVCRRRLLRDAGLLPPEVLGETSGAGEGSSRDVAGPSTRVLAGVDVDEDEGDFVPICDAVQNGR